MTIPDFAWEKILSPWVVPELRKFRTGSDANESAHAAVGGDLGAEREFAVPTDRVLGPPGAGAIPSPFTEGDLDRGELPVPPLARCWDGPAGIRTRV